MAESREYVIIENGIAKRIRETTLKAAKEEDLVARISARHSKMDTGLLPSGTVALSRSGSQSRLLLWRPPTVRTFQVSKGLAIKIDNDTNTSRTTVTLPMPAQLFGLTILGSSVVNIFLWFMLDVPDSISRLAYIAPLPNQTESGKMCAGAVSEVLAGEPLPKLCQTVISHFYASLFNDELPLAGKARFAFLRDWEFLTPLQAAEPERWEKHQTLGTLIERFQ